MCQRQDIFLHSFFPENQSFTHIGVGSHVMQLHCSAGHGEQGSAGLRTSGQHRGRKDALELRGGMGPLPRPALLFIETGLGVSCRRLLTRMASADLGCAASCALCAHLAALASSAFSSSRLARASMQLRHDQGPCDKPGLGRKFVIVAERLARAWLANHVP